MRGFRQITIILFHNSWRQKKWFLYLSDWIKYICHTARDWGFFFFCSCVVAVAESEDSIFSTGWCRDTTVRARAFSDEACASQEKPFFFLRSALLVAISATDIWKLESKSIFLRRSVFLIQTPEARHGRGRGRGRGRKTLAVKMQGLNRKWKFGCN